MDENQFILVIIKIMDFSFTHFLVISKGLFLLKLRLSIIIVFYTKKRKKKKRSLSVTVSVIGDSWHFCLQLGEK